MQKVNVTENDAGQRLDKFIRRTLPSAGTSFIFKMLRKKNITLNGAKADGQEIVRSGDTVTFFFSDETFRKFQTGRTDVPTRKTYEAACKQIERQYGKIRIVFENDQLLLADKPAGLLSQKAEPSDLTLNEWFVGRMLLRGETDDVRIHSFRPSVCNRLDRNTTGIVICAKTLPASRAVSSLLKNRGLEKYYHLIAAGKMPERGEIEGWLVKDGQTNQVTVYQRQVQGSAYSRTLCRTLCYSKERDISLVEAQLITGKTHQLRAHLASIGHPILGDPKYGTEPLRRKWAAAGIHRQLLHCCRVVFPETDGCLSPVSGRTFICADPAVFQQIIGKGAAGEREVERTAVRAPHGSRARGKR